MIQSQSIIALLRETNQHLAKPEVSEEVNVIFIRTPTIDDTVYVVVGLQMPHVPQITVT